MAEIHHHLATPPKPLTASQVKPVCVKLQGRLAEFAHNEAGVCHVMAATPTAAVSAVASLLPKVATALRHGRYYLYAEAGGRPKMLSAAVLASPLPEDISTLTLIPEVAGSGRGRGKALLGLTLLGLSFIPGVNHAIGSGFASVGQSFGANATTTAALGQFGSQLLGRTGALLMLAGATEMLAPQHRSEAGALTSAALTPPSVVGQGAAIPLVYGKTIVDQPIIISSGLSVETE